MLLSTAQRILKANGLPALVAHETLRGVVALGLAHGDLSDEDFVPDRPDALRETTYDVYDTPPLPCGRRVRVLVASNTRRGRTVGLVREGETLLCWSAEGVSVFRTLLGVAMTRGRTWEVPAGELIVNVHAYPVPRRDRLGRGCTVILNGVKVYAGTDGRRDELLAFAGGALETGVPNALLDWLQENGAVVPEGRDPNWPGAYIAV